MDEPEWVVGEICGLATFRGHFVHAKKQRERC